MSDADQNLSVRRSARRVIGLPAELEVEPEHSDAVRVAGAGTIAATATDMSEGGIGALASGFLPKRCLAQIRVLSPIDAEKTLLTARVRVSRAAMVDRRPGYQLGLSFEDSSNDFRTRLVEFLSLVDAAT